MKRKAFAVIDTTRLRHNLELIRRHVSKARIMAVVKANAYGHGLVECAHALSAADALAVSCVNEAIALRENRCDLPIVCLQGYSDIDELKACISFGLHPVIHQAYQLSLLESFTTTGKIDVWLKLDTGMGRLGFFTNEAESVYQQLKNIPAVQTVRIMTHFANADDRSSSSTVSAISSFQQTCARLPATEYSTANSAAIFAFPESHLQWVRPGLALYGVSPFITDEPFEPQSGLQPVMKVFAPIISIKEFSQGDLIGYGSTYRCPGTSRIAVVALGYNEGYPRTLNQPMAVAIRQTRAMIVGRVSMDMITVDISHIACQVGDVVEVWGDTVSVREIALAADTIPYELLCNTSGSIYKKFT